MAVDRSSTAQSELNMAGVPAWNVRVSQRLIVVDLLHKRINHPNRGADVPGCSVRKTENPDKHRQPLRHQDGCEAYSAHEHRVFRALAEQHLEGYIGRCISEAQA